MVLRMPPCADPLPFEIRELSNASDWSRAWPAMAALRPYISRERFLSNREPLIADGYRLFGVEHEGEIVCVAGVSLRLHVLGEPELWINDLATLADRRSCGFGSALMKHIEGFARERNCFRIVLYSRLSREDAHRFYEEKAGFERTALTFVKKFRDPIAA